jgi:hypothetical protein
VMLPPNCTAFLQPMDIGCNAPLKWFMEDRWTTWAVEKYQRARDVQGVFKLEKPKRAQLSGWINDAWQALNGSVIVNSFIKSGMIDGEEELGHDGGDDIQDDADPPEMSSDLPEINSDSECSDE